MLEGERTVELKIQGVQEWGDHLLQVSDASCGEHLSRPYSCSLTLVSDQGEDVAEALPEMIGRHAILRVEVVGTVFRYFSGIVRSFVQTGVQDRRTLYAMEIVPWLWFLGHRRNYRIFQFQDVPAILATVFDEWMQDLGDAEAFRYDKEALKGPFTARDYCVQYDETDLEFVERLMQEEGVAYFFVHDEKGHELVLVDQPEQHRDYRLENPLRLALSDARDIDSITDFVLDQDSLPAAHVVSDYHFEQPGKACTDSKQAPVPFARELHEVFHHPAGPAEPFVGKEQAGSTRLAGEMPNLAKRLAQLRVEAAECEMIRARGGSYSPLLTPGYLIEVDSRPGDFDTGAVRGYYRRIDGEYLVVSVSHQMAGGGHRGTQSFSYSNTFEALPQKVAFVEKLGLPQPLVFRPPRLAEKPRARGPETAMVVGPTKDSKEEIWTDKYGRVLVRFFWDRRDKADEWSSCWVRVAQPWAGKRWGAVFIPRIGQEVIVDFLGGDPDRPIITGSVYNADQMPPYLGDGPDPKFKHDPRMSGIKTNSTPGGKGFNELRFYDAKGKEQVFLHAERDQHNRVRNDSFEFVGQHRHLIVKKSQFERVDGDKHLTVGGDRNEKIGGTISRHAGMDIQEKAGMKHALDAGMEVHLKAGMNIVLEAGLSITLKAGGGFIVVGPTGVTISGIPVLINSGGAAGAGSGASPEAPQRPKEAEIAKPGEQAEPPPPPEPPSPAAVEQAAAQRETLKEAAKSGVPFCEKCEAARRAAAGG